MIYLFNSSEEVIKIVPSTAIRSFYQTQSLTSEKYISDRVDIELKALPEEILKQIEYVAIPDIQDKYRFHLFFVVREATEGNITEITGVQSGIEELRKSPVYDIRPQDSPVRLAAERIIQGTNWTVGYAPDDVRVGNMNVYYSSAFDGLKTLCEKTDVEMQFFVEINGNKVGNRYIEFKKRIGKNVGRRVVYGHNALQIVKEVEKTDLVTALVGRGRGEEVSSAEENAGGVAGYGRKITFEDIEWKKANGDPVDKPLGQKYVEIPEMTAIYGVQTPTGKRPKFGFIEFDTDDKAEVLRRTYEALQWVSRPKVELKTSSVYLKDTYIGDTVRVIRHDRGLAYETRVFEIKIDRISGRCEIKLGDKLSGNDGLSVSKLSSQITNLENSLSQTVQNIVTNLPSADGFTRNWYTDQEPSDPRIGDTWFKPDPEHEGHTIMLTWNGEVWDEILRTYNDTRVADKLAEIDTQTQSMEAAIQANEAKAREAFEQAGASADLASEAQRLADEAKQAHASLSQEVSEAKADLVQKGLELSQLTENFGITERKVEELDGAIKETVTRSDYDALTGRVSQAETTIQSQAGEIRQRLTRTEVESAITGKGYITSDALTPYATAVSVENTVKETADGINRTITEVRGLIPTEVGGRNLIRNGAFPEVLVHWRDYSSSNFTTAKHDFYYSGTKNIFVLQTNGTREVMVSSNRFELKRNTDYTLSFYGFMSSNTSNIDVLLLGRKKDETADFTSALNIIDKRRLNAAGTEYVTATFNSGEVDTAFLRFDNNGSTNGSMSWFFFGEVMLVEGKIARTWEAALADLEGITDSKIAIYKQTVDGQFADLSNRYADKTEFAKVQTTAKLSEQIFGATDKDGAITNISREILSSSIYQTEVTNAVRGNIIENGAYMTTTDQWGGVNLITHSFYKDGKVNMFVITTNQAGEKVGNTKHYKVKRNTDYSFSSIVFASSNVSSVDVYALGRRTGETSNFTIIRQLVKERKASPSNAEYWTGTFNTGEMDELFLRFDNNGSTNGLNASLFFTEVTLTEGNIPKPWSVPIAETVAMSTKVTQLAGSWAVQNLNANGDVLSAINLATGGASIQAGTNKLVVTPDTTYIQSGTIKSTHIGTAQINTAHISEIDASRARIINLDVNSLTGDHARFLRVLLNGANSSVKLDGRELAIMRTDNTYAAKFHENGLTLFRDGIKVGSLMSLNAVETYGYYNNLRSISLTTEPGSYIGFSYYSSQDDVYYRAFALGGDGRLRFHSPLYDGISNYGFRLGNTTMGTQKASTWRDTISGGGLIVTIDMDTHLSMSNGQWINITRIWDNLQSCIRRIESLESAARSSNSSYTPPTTSTTPSKPVSKTLQVGTIVKIKSHITYYYDENDNRITIPENKNGRNYRLETYTIGKIATNSRVAKYCLYLEGWAIAWVTPDLVDIQ